jgi:O-antigen ligase
VDYEQGIRFVRPSAILPKTEIYSTIGNPNYLAAVMAFLLPVTAALARVPRADGGMGRGWRMLLWASALCSGVAVILSRSKGGLVAVVAGLVFFLLLLAHAEQWTMKRLLAAAGRWLAAGLLVLAVAGGLMLGMGTVDALTTEWARLSHLSWEAPTIKGRLLMWQTAARMIAAHPVVGIGAGTFGAQYQPYRAQVFDRVTEPAAVYPASEPSYNETGQVHNDYLQLAAETGLVGLALFVTLVVLCYRCGLGLLRDPPATAQTPLARSLLCGLLAGIAVILTHALMDFPLSQPVAALLFWLAVGTVVAFAVQAAGSGHRLQQWRPQWLQWGWARWGVGVVGLFLAMAFMAQAVRPVVAGAYQREAWLLLSQQRWAAAASTAEKGLSWDAANSELLLYLGAAQYQQGHLDGSRAAYQQYQLLYRDFQTLYNLGLIAVKEEDFSKADAYFLEALRYKPTLAEAAMQLAVVAERTGRPDEARRWRRQAARLRGIG